MMKICSNYVRQHTTSLWDHYIARISFEVDRHLAVHDLTTTHMSHNHVVPSHTAKFLSVWMHLHNLILYKTLPLQIEPATLVSNIGQGFDHCAILSSLTMYNYTENKCNVTSYRLTPTKPNVAHATLLSIDAFKIWLIFCVNAWHWKRLEYTPWIFGYNREWIRIR